MSTHRGLMNQHLPPGSAERMREIRTPSLKHYACVYCGRILADQWSIPAHENQCDMRRPMLVIYARQRAKFLAAAARHAALDKD